jgi:hypothetical protein
MRLILTRFFILFILLVTLDRALTSTMKFHKIENCTASGRSAKIEKCEIEGNNLVMVVDILKPITKAFVSFEFFSVVKF